MLPFRTRWGPAYKNLPEWRSAGRGMSTRFTENQMRVSDFKWTTCAWPSRPKISRPVLSIMNFDELSEDPASSDGYLRDVTLLNRAELPFCERALRAPFYRPAVRGRRENPRRFMRPGKSLSWGLLADFLRSLLRLSLPPPCLFPGRRMPTSASHLS
jgi:hypothetical protein